MIVILLGILDIIAALSIFTINLSWGPVLISFSILYLLAKSLPFLKSFASIMDIKIGILDIIAALSIFTINLSWGPVLISFSILYLLAKSLPFLKSFASIMDIIV